MFNFGYTGIKKTILLHKNEIDHTKLSFSRTLKNCSLGCVLIFLSLYFVWYNDLAKRGWYFELLTFSWVPQITPFVYAVIALIVGASLLHFQEGNKTTSNKYLRPFEYLSRILSFEICQNTLVVLLVYVLFFALSSFVLVDSDRIAKKAIVHIPTSTLEKMALESTEESGRDNEKSFWPRTRLLTTHGEFWSRFLFPVLGGVLAIIALFFTYQRTTAIIQQSENGQREIVVGQFKDAIDQLGSEKRQVVLGGVYTLHQIAFNNVLQYANTVQEILCCFIKDETNKKEFLDQIKKESPRQSTSNQVCQTKLILPDYYEHASTFESEEMNSKPASTIIVQAILDILFNYVAAKTIYKNIIADLSGACLPEVNLPFAELPKARLSGIKLQRSNLIGANLQEAFLMSSHLNEADLSHANLQKATMSSSNLTSAKLISARLDNAEMIFSLLHKADLSDAHLYNANLWSVDFHEAIMIGTHMQRARMNAAKLGGACLWNSVFHGAFMMYTVFDEYTELNDADFRGVQSDAKAMENIQKALKNKSDLPTNLEKVIVMKDGYMISLSHEEKLSWFASKGAKVKPLPAKAVQELFRGDLRKE